MMPSAHPSLAAGVPPATIARFPSLPSGLPNGYVYNLLRHWGASDFAARSAQFFLVRPLEIVLIAVVAWLSGRAGARFARRLLSPFAHRAATAAKAAPGDGARPSRRLTTIGQTVASLWKALVWTIAGLMILSAVGIDLTPLVAGATVVGAALAFGAQRIVLDLLSGFFLLVEDQFGVGDTVTVGETTGVVEEFHLRVTRLRAGDGTSWYVPNGEIRVLGNRPPGFTQE